MMYNSYSVLMSIYKNDLVDNVFISINSILNQTIPPEQFILVLDGPCHPDVEKYVDSLFDSNNQLFTVVKLPVNKGLAFALNCGLEKSRNELIARMDSDDYSLPTRCEKELEEFNRDDTLALVGTNVGFFLDNSLKAIEFERYYPLDFEEIKKTLRRNDPFAHPSVMFKKSAVILCGGYDPILRRRQDYDLFSKMVVSKNMNAKNLKEKLLLFRLDENYCARNKSKESCRNRVLVQKKIYDRGACSYIDYLYIRVLMMITKLIPLWLYKRIFFRVKGKKGN